MTLPKILITGGAGYLGYHIALVLKAAGNLNIVLFFVYLRQMKTKFLNDFRGLNLTAIIGRAII